MRFKTYLIAFLLSVPAIFAQQNDSKAFGVKPIGRLQLDGALYITPMKQFHDGVALSESRLGVVATYDKFLAKIELGYAFGTVSARDIYLQANLTPELTLRAGYQLQQYGLNYAYSASNKSTMEQPVSNAIFETPRSLSVLAIYDTDNWLLAGSLLVEPKAITKSTDELGAGTAWGANTRLVFRDFKDGEYILQAGWSGGYMSPEYSDTAQDNHKAYSLSGNYPTKVARINALKATVGDARSLFKFTPELLLSYKQFAIESQYYFDQINRRDNLAAYRAYGAYAILRGILFGDKSYKYNRANAFLDNPSNRSLELALSYNYTCLSDRSAEIYGGRLSDVSATLSWYINKYMVWRLRYSYTHVWNRAGERTGNLGAFQTRIQFVF